MKKSIALIAALALGVAGFASCAKKPAPTTTLTQPTTTGSYTSNK